MMVEALPNPTRMRGWLDCGGDTTLASYGGEPSLLPSGDISNGSTASRLTHFDRQRIYVHAGLDAEFPLERQSEKTLLTKRYPAGLRSRFRWPPRRPRP